MGAETAVPPALGRNLALHKCTGLLRTSNAVLLYQGLFRGLGIVGIFYRSCSYSNEHSPADNKNSYCTVM